MDQADAKADLHRYLQVAREVLLWKLEGLDEYDLRRPLTRSGTNLLGLVKHLAGVEAGYFGACFGRPFPEHLPWDAEDAEDDADMWATADEASAELVALYQRVWTHADATIEAHDLADRGRVPWWGEHGDVSLHRLLVHVATETHRHAGHADIVREWLDGATGHRPGVSNMADRDDAWWTAHHGRIEEAARAFRG